MAETMKDYEAELEASFKKIEEGDILTESSWRLARNFSICSMGVNELSIWV